MKEIRKETLMKKRTQNNKRSSVQMFANEMKKIRQVGEEKGPIIIGITGATKSGKTWVTNVLADWLKIPASCIIRTDDYKKGPVEIVLDNGERV